MNMFVVNLQVRGSGINAEVQVIVNNKTAHINDLIAKQRAPKPSKSRFVFQVMLTFSLYNYQYYIFRNHRRPNRNVQYPSDRRNFSNYINYISDSLSFKPVEDVAGSETSSNLDYLSVACSTPVHFEESDLCKGAVPKQTINKVDDMEEIYFSDEENRKNTRVPLLIQDNLRRLIVKYSDGVMCSSLSEIYK